MKVFAAKIKWLHKKQRGGDRVAGRETERARRKGSCRILADKVCTPSWMFNHNSTLLH